MTNFKKNINRKINRVGKKIKCVFKIKKINTKNNCKNRSLFGGMQATINLDMMPFYSSLDAVIHNNLGSNVSNIDQ